MQQNAIEDIVKLATREISKFMKPILDKIQEFALKILNQGIQYDYCCITIQPEISIQGHGTGQITELMLCMYNKMTGGLARIKLAAALTDALGSAHRQWLSNVQQSVQNGEL